MSGHRRSQDFCWGGAPGRCHPVDGTRSMPPGRCYSVDATRSLPPSLASVVYTFEALAGSWGSVSAPAVSRIMGGAQSETKLQQNIREMTFEGGIFFYSCQYRHLVIITELRKERHLVITYTLKESNNIT